MNTVLRGRQGLPAPGSLRGADLWWLHPSLIVLLLIVPVYLSFLSFDFSRVVKNVYIPSGYYVFGLALILCLPLGIQWALAHQRPQVLDEAPRISRGVMALLFGLAIAAYAIWFGPLLAKPQLLLEIVSGQRAQVRNEISTMPGVTTFTQLGVAYALAYGIKWARPQELSRLEHIGFALLLVLAVFRAFAWAERLAVIEYIVCFFVARMASVQFQSPRHGRLAALAPVFGPPALYLIFTASEYFRSWEFYVDKYDSIWAFTLDRLITYYATASNNGIGILHDTDAWPHFNGAFVFKWAWTMPGLGNLLSDVFGPMRTMEDEWLDVFARPEFNSPTSYFRFVLDFGFFGSVLYCLLLGYVIGRAYASFRGARTFGLLLYPLFVIFIVESLRFSYLGETRVVPLMVGLGILALDIRRGRNRVAAHAQGLRATGSAVSSP